MMAELLTDLWAAVQRDASPVELGRHVDGIAAVMESHFQYEERALLTVLDALALNADPRELTGPL